eukprot:599983-Prorocentrum_minimum.AAC.2
MPNRAGQPSLDDKSSSASDDRLALLNIRLMASPPKSHASTCPLRAPSVPVALPRSLAPRVHLTLDTLKHVPCHSVDCPLLNIDVNEGTPAAFPATGAHLTTRGGWMSRVCRIETTRLT